MTDEILTVRIVSKDGGDYICRCPHCGKIVTLDGSELSEVQGEQYQHRVRTSYGSAGCDGWFEIAFNAKRVALLPKTVTAGDPQEEERSCGGGDGVPGGGDAR